MPKTTEGYLRLIKWIVFFMGLYVCLYFLEISFASTQTGKNIFSVLIITLIFVLGKTFNHLKRTTEKMIEKLEEENKKLRNEIDLLPKQEEED